MSQMVSFMACVFYHNKKSEKKILWRTQNNHGVRSLGTREWELNMNSLLLLHTLGLRTMPISEWLYKQRSFTIT